MLDDMEWYHADKTTIAESEIRKTRRNLEDLKKDKENAKSCIADGIRDLAFFTPFAALCAIGAGFFINRNKYIDGAFVFGRPMIGLGILAADGLWFSLSSAVRLVKTNNCIRDQKKYLKSLQQSLLDDSEENEITK